jgi:hypothetical protein
MANRHLFNAPIPGSKDLDVGARLHGDNLEEEIRDATGLRAVEVTLVGESLQVAIAGERPAGELEDLEKQIKGVIRKHRGMTEDQVQDLTKREGGRKRLKQLGAKVAGGEELTEDEVWEAVSMWLLSEADPMRRFGRRS